MKKAKQNKRFRCAFPCISHKSLFTQHPLNTFRKNILVIDNECFILGITPNPDHALLRFFSESFGVPNGMDDWSMGVKDLGEDGAGFGANSSTGGNSSSSWSASFEISWGNSSGGMGGFNGSMSGGSNNSMPGGPSFNGSFSGGQIFNNSMMGQGGEAATTARPPADVTVTSDQDLQERMERDQMEAKAKRFYQMDQQQRAKVRKPWVQQLSLQWGFIPACKVFKYVSIVA